jgi:putative sterol carrier protein
MSTQVNDYFKQKLGHSYDERFANIQGSYQFNVKDAGSWHLSVDHGNLDCTEESKSADCVISIGKSDMSEILNKRRNLITAFLQGRVAISGSRTLAAAAHNFFKKAA